MNICTLFNSYYLDKGLALYESLVRTTNDLHLYILAMDDRCYDILCDLNYQEVIPICLKDFENEELLSVKPLRSVGEYCWTCTPWLIDYIMTRFSIVYCTYVDADMFFYSDPSVIITEMKDKDASVQVVEHRFDSYSAKRSERKVGKYCVEFNTFKNDFNGRSLLNLWKYQCLNKCTIKEGKGRYWGDQKYLDFWVEDYPFVISTEHIGLGLAPWNITTYDIIRNDNNTFFVSRYGRRDILLCCHYESIFYIDKNLVDIHAVGSWKKRKDYFIIEHLYMPYLQKLHRIQNVLCEKYNIELMKKSHPDFRNRTVKERLLNYCYMVTRSNFFPSLFLYHLPRFIYKKRNIIKIIENTNR